MFHLGQQLDYFLFVCSFLTMFARAGCLPRLAWSGCRRMGNFSSSYARSHLGMSPAQYIQDVVSSNCIVIFSKTTCPYCTLTKNLFNKIGANYKVIELDQHHNGRKMQGVLGQMTGARTVPRVFVNGKFIGGCSETDQLHQQGKLEPMIDQCNCSGEGSGTDQFVPIK